MLLVANNDSTRQARHGDREILAQCDDVSYYKECGWYCLTGWQGKKRVLHLHFNSAEDRDWFVDPKAEMERRRADGHSKYRNYYGH